MGLVITAYKNVEKLQDVKRDSQGLVDPSEQVEIFFGNSAWKQGDDLQEGEVYSFSDTISVFFCPYGYYSSFRNELARVAGYKPVDESAVHSRFGPPALYSMGCWALCDNGEWGLLSELINFADNEGEIGVKSCKKIANDLQTLESRKNEMASEYRELFDSLLQTFKFASENGIVQFG
ncbi:MAG: hypothetical protein ACTIJH_06410 [Moraxellaceae bacterium]